MYVRDVEVKGFGRRAEGEALLKNTPDVTVGLPFLLGATVRFLENGTCDIAFPART